MEAAAAAAKEAERAKLVKKKSGASILGAHKEGRGRSKTRGNSSSSYSRKAKTMRNEKGQSSDSGRDSHRGRDGQRGLRDYERNTLSSYRNHGSKNF